MIRQEIFFKVINYVILITFLTVNCAWAGEMPADKLAAQSHVNDTLALAKAVYTGTALHSALITQDIRELQALYYNQTIIRKKLREKLGDAVDNLKTLIFADKTDSKKIAYYTFTQDGYFYRFTNAKDVNDPFLGLIKEHLTSPLDSRAVLIGKNEYSQETLQVPAGIANLINACLGEIYPDAKMEISAEIKTEQLEEEEPQVVRTREYFIIDKATGSIVERLSISGVRILRKKGLNNTEIQKGIDEGRFIIKTWDEMLAGLNRQDCGIGITGGGDCAGIADFLGSLRRHMDSRLTMLGVRYAGKGLMVSPERFSEQLILVDDLAAEDLIEQASTPFGSARENPLKKAYANTVANIGGHGFFYGTGGNDHLGLLEQIAGEFPDMVVVGTFKSIDGDGWVNGRPAQMLGFHSAVEFYRRAILSAAQNARTHGEMHVVEVFGRNCGKLAFESARRYPPDFAKLSKEEQRKIIECRDRMLILVPEKPVTLRNIAEKAKSVKISEGSCVVVVAEGFLPPELKQEMDRLAKDEELKEKWISRKLTIEEIPNLIKYEGDNDPRKDLFLILQDRELAAQFGKTVWETELDAHGNVTKLAGIRKFIIQSIIKLGGIKKVNELIENYEARGASPTEYDTVMGQKIGKKMAELVNQGIKGGKAVVYFEGMDAMAEDPVVVDLVGVSDKNNLNNSGLYPEELLQENGVFWVREDSQIVTDRALRGSHIVRSVSEGESEELLYNIKLDNSGKFKIDVDNTDDKLSKLQQALDRLVDIYGLGVLTRVEGIQVVNNLNAGRLYPNGRAPLANYSDGILKIDAQALAYGPWIVFEEIEHEFLESIAGLIPGSNEILSDVTSTYWNVQRFLNPNRGVTKDEYKWDVKKYQDAFIEVLESKENPIDPDGEYLALLKRLRDLQGEIKDDDIIALVVIYVFRTKLYEAVRDQLGIPEDLARQIKGIDLKKLDALTVFNEIAKVKQGEKLVSDIRDSKELAIKVIKTFSETVRIEGLEKLSKRLAEIIAGAVKAASRMEEVAGIAQAKIGGKYCIVIDKNRIPDGMQDKWDNEIKRLEKNNVYKVVYSLDEALRDYRPGNIIYLLDPADIKEEDKMRKDILYLPMPYIRTSLYMAAVVVAGDGDIQKIDPLVTGLIMDLYKQILVRDDITVFDLKNLFTAPWRILPEIINVLGDINNLRKTLVEIEKAA